MCRMDAAIAAHAPCPYALTAAIFGPEPARALASRLPVGTVLINDLIVATADPRVSFGGTQGQRLRRHPRPRRFAGDDYAQDDRRPAQPRPARLSPHDARHQPFFAAYLEAFTAVAGGPLEGPAPVLRAGSPARLRPGFLFLGETLGTCVLQ
jgi:hypothetical protein